MPNLANALVSRGIRVDVVIANRPESDYLDEVRPEVRLVDIDASPAAFGFPRLLRYLRRENPEVTLSFEPGGHLMLLAARKLLGGRFRAAASIQNLHSREFGTDIGKARSLRLRSMSLALPRMDHVIAVAGRVADDVVENFGVPRDLVEVIYNPILTGDIQEKASRSVDHPWFGDCGPPVVVSVGRLTRQKNYPLLLRAFRELTHEREARLVVFGKGEELGRLESLTGTLGLQGSVSFPGFVDNPFAHVARADAFILSSDWEGLPSVLIEALAVGCPVVSTDCPSVPREILADGRFGRLVPMCDPVRLADAIAATLDEETDRSRLRERAGAFSSNKVADEYVRELFGGGVGA
jgi:glycosyltransferase involved in cell wall biosynthesis